ncbi:MAG TPA: NAD(P)H-quinone oxidoreductase [Pyrinomonadaceae bacterium]|nr:NAD(P)H-quinone oxidoreductase [Pyrinomonadaceae bacterium]
MKAVTIVRHGGVEGLEVYEVENPPTPTANLVRVRVRAAALNRADILQRRGHYPAPPGFPPDIPGLEFAGEVDAVGERVRSWKTGDRVFGITGGGAQAELTVLPDNHLTAIPANLDWASAAAVPEAFITAHDALFTQAQLRMGETILVHAAGSGVGTAAVQLGRAAGARIFGTSRTPEKLEKAKSYGLSGTLVIKNDSAILIEAVQEWTAGQGIDVIIDLVGAGYLEANLSSLATCGRMVLVGTTSGSRATLNFGKLMSKRGRLIGTVLRSRSAEEKATATRLFARQVVPLFLNGQVKPVIDSVYSLEQVRDAHLRMESNETFGKVVLLID